MVKSSLLQSKMFYSQSCLMTMHERDGLRCLAAIGNFILEIMTRWSSSTFYVIVIIDELKGCYNKEAFKGTTIFNLKESQAFIHN